MIQHFKIEKQCYEFKNEIKMQTDSYNENAYCNKSNNANTQRVTAVIERIK